MGALQGIDDGKVYIVLQKDGLLLSLEMEPGQIKGIGGPVRFESKDCSGQPYIEDLGKIFPGTEIFNYRYCNTGDGVFGLAPAA